MWLMQNGAWPFYASKNVNDTIDGHNLWFFLKYIKRAYETPIVEFHSVCSPQLTKRAYILQCTVVCVLFSSFLLVEFFVQYFFKVFVALDSITLFHSFWICKLIL